MSREIQIRSVGSDQFAVAAATILYQAWEPPCLEYTEKFLRWHCGFPSDLPPILLLGYEHGHPVAAVAAMGRITGARQIYTSSFLSRIPAASPAVVIEMQLHLARLLYSAHQSSVSFVIPGSAGEKLAACCGMVGLTRTPLGEYRVYGATGRFESPDFSVEASGHHAWADHARELRAPELLSLTLDRATVDHLADDPGGREFLLVRQQSSVVATAMLSTTFSLTSAGKVATPTLHGVRMRDQTVGAVRALLAYACRKGELVSVPNASGIAQDIRQPAGLRPTRSMFKAILAETTPARERFLATELEIV